MASAWLVGIGFVLFSLAMYALVVRYGPRRGHFMQPAAELRPPGRRLRISLYVVAAVHLLLGIIGAFAVPFGLGWTVFVVALFTAGFYVACAEVMAIVARSPSRLRPAYVRERWDDRTA